MVRRSLIALTLHLIVMPHAFASQCNSYEWKILQDNYAKLERGYNAYASKYNRLLDEHRDRPLLSQQFAFEELVQLWQRLDVVYQGDLQQQIRSARQYANAMVTLNKQIVAEHQYARTMAQNWYSMADTCRQQRHTANFNSALWYHRASLSLAKDLLHLEQKMALLGDIYNNEAAQLENARLAAQETD